MTMSANIHSQKILILDFGSQYTQLIARRIREIGVYCELWAWDVNEKQIRNFAPDGIILSGGPESVPEKNSPRAPQYVFNAGVPVLGICYGMQTMAHQLGGAVKGSDVREFGYAQVELLEATKLFDKIEDEVGANGNALLDVWMSHGDKVSAVPKGFKTIAQTDSCPHAAMANEDKHFYGVQFHPEVTHTKQGMRVLEHFAMNICACEKLWTAGAIIEDAVARIKKQVGNDQVILGLSGGVDSSVTAMLLHQAIGDKLTCVFVDNGLLRLDEGQQVMDMFGDHFGLNIIKIDAEKRFLDALAGEVDPEKKRKIIGNQFVYVFDEESKKLKDAKWLAQGTIYPDVLHKAELYHKVSQAFTVFLPVRSVGVMGDMRKYDWVVSIRAVETIDFMTARWAHLPYEFLGKVSNRIINEVDGISRVVYDISGKPPATIEWE